VADSDNFPVKSLNLDEASSVLFHALPFTGGGVNPALFDAHPVHGISTQDLGVVMVGKGIEAEVENAKMEAFAIKVDSQGEFVWGWRYSPILRPFISL